MKKSAKIVIAVIAIVILAGVVIAVAVLNNKKEDSSNTNQVSNATSDINSTSPLDGPIKNTNLVGGQTE